MLTNISRREFKEGELFLGKLRSWWSHLFKALKVFPYGEVEMWSQPTRVFKVNGKRLKHYVTNAQIEEKVANTFFAPLK